jgi:hypothetical protein
MMAWIGIQITVLIKRGAQITQLVNGTWYINASHSGVKIKLITTVVTNTD